MENLSSVQVKFLSSPIEHEPQPNANAAIVSKLVSNPNKTKRNTKISWLRHSVKCNGGTMVLGGADGLLVLVAPQKGGGGGER